MILEKKYILREVEAKFSLGGNGASGDLGVYAFSAANSFIPLEFRMKGTHLDYIGASRVQLFFSEPILAVQDYEPLPDPIIPISGLSQVFSIERSLLNASQIDFDSILLPPGNYYYISAIVNEEFVGTNYILLLERN